MRIMGIDMAWETEKNPSAIAVGTLSENRFTIDRIHHAVTGFDNIQRFIEAESTLSGISVDAPLIITNTSGQRDCEKQLNQKYRDRHAGCHSTNLSLYPDAASVRLSQYLSTRDFQPLGKPGNTKWQIECYPHPALVELFQLPKRLLYKKGSPSEKKEGQKKLARLIMGLSKDRSLALTIDEQYLGFLDAAAIEKLEGKQQIKENEDTLDAIICGYIGACYAGNPDNDVFGENQTGYIYVPVRHQQA